MGHQIFFFFVTFITRVAFSSGAELQVTAKVYERFLLACPSFSYRGNVREIKWYRCSPRNNDCDTDWRDFQIAYVDSMNETKADIPNFDVYTNGTLVIKMVQPTDDGVMFICSAEKYYAERIQNTTILNIAQDPPKLIPECPRSIHVIKGMDLHMDALVQSYPYPWVTWSHNGRLLQNTSNVASETRLKICNVTANQDGRYSCYAENIFGHDIFTVDVKVQEENCTPTQTLPCGIKKVTTSPALETQRPSTSPPPKTPRPLASPPLKTQRPTASSSQKTQKPSASPPLRKEDGKVLNWLTLIFVVLLVIAHGYTIRQLTFLLSNIKSIQDRVNGFERPVLFQNVVGDQDVLEPNGGDEQ